MPSAAMRSSEPLRSSARSEPPWPSGESARLPGRLEEDLAGEVNGRHAALPEEVHPRRVEPEVPVLLEVGQRRLVVLVARHDEPVERPAVAPARGEDLLGEDLEEGMVP